MGDAGKVSAGQGVVRPVFDSYGRLSWNPSTRELEKIETQHEDNRVTIDRHGGVRGEELSDGLSAWKKGVRRAGFERLLERARAGVSQGIAVWHVDRLFRQPRDLEKLIDLADRGFRVISSHGSRDLSDPDDRFILRIEVAHAARSSDDTSRRILRRQQRYREEGRPTGGRPGFGFARQDRSWSPGPAETEEDRPGVSAELLARERRALRDAVDGLVARVSTQAGIAREWNAAGLFSTEGREWIPTTVRDTLGRPILAGRIEHEGVLVGRAPGVPIVAEKDWLRLRAMFEARRRGAPPRERYLGSGLIRCGACGLTLSGHSFEGSDRGTISAYRCNRQRRGCGRVNISMRGVDREMRALTIARLSDSRYAQAISAARSRVSERLTELDTETAQIRSLQSALSEKLGRREMALPDFERSYGFLRADLEPLREERDSLSGGSVEGPSEAMNADEVATQWDDADSVAERRAMLADAIGTDEVRVYPSERKTRMFDPRRIRLVHPSEPLTHQPTSHPGSAQK